MVRIRTALAATVLAATAVIGTAGAAAADPNPPVVGTAQDSPGVLSGDVIQVPVTVPVNACGDTIDLIGLLNPAAGNTCVNH
ncbi:chaplin [Streptomyces xanthochromogenes]|uniref:chaplin n=1 Tax=Streptomyces xanthochromogenes TaxID=67384 RepID=UPI003570E8CD